MVEAGEEREPLNLEKTQLENKNEDPLSRRGGSTQEGETRTQKRGPAQSPRRLNTRRGDENEP